MPDHERTPPCHRPETENLVLTLAGILCLCAAFGCDASDSIIGSHGCASIDSVAVSPDGRLIATAGDDRTAQIWTIREKRKLAQFSGIWSVDFSPDGRFLAAGADWQKEAIIWDVAGDCKFRELPTVEKAATMHVRFLPDSRHLVCGYTSEVRVWNIEDGTTVMRYKHPEWSDTGISNYISAIAISPTGKRIAVGDFDGMISILDASSGDEVVQRWKGYDKASGVNIIHNLAFSADGRVLSSSSYNNAIKLWDASTGKLAREFDAKGGSDCFAWSLDETKLAANDGLAVCIWQWGAMPRLLLKRRTWVRGSMVFSKGGELLVVGGSGKGSQSEVLLLRTPQ